MGSKKADVVPVIWFFNSSKVYPIASLADILAIGYPVAFDAKQMT